MIPLQKRGGIFMTTVFGTLTKAFLWSNSSTTNQPVVQSHPDLTFVFQQIYRHFHELDTDALRTLSSILAKHKVEQDHEVMKRIEAKVQSSTQLTLKTSKNILQKILVSPPESKISAPHLDDATSFIDDGLLPLDEIKKLLAQRGDKLTKLTVSRWEFDEKYFPFLVYKCPRLQELHLGVGDYYWIPIKGLNDKSLQPLAQLKDLKSLRIKFSGESYSVTQLTNLLAQPSLQQNLQKLELPQGIEPDDQYIACIQKYSNLKNLILPCYKESTILALINAPSLIKTVESLKYSGHLNDSICVDLGKFKNLTSLHIHCLKWNVGSSSSLAKGLSALTHLENLTFRKIPVRDDIAASLENCMHLTKVSIDNIDAHPGLAALLKNKNKLKILDLRGLNFLTDQFNALYELKALTSLRLQFKKNDSGFCKEDGGLNPPGLQKLAEVYKDQLEEFSLSNNKMEWQSDTYIDAFANCTKLKKLILSDCPLVNDHSILKLSLGPLQNTLKHLELRKLSVSDISIEYLARFKKLTKLLISNCYGLTEKGRQSLVQNSYLQNQLRALALGSFALSKEMAFHIIQNFRELTDFSMYNSAPEYGNDSSFTREMLKLAKQKNPQMRLYVGNMQYRQVDYDDFHINFGFPFGTLAQTTLHPDALS